ncbi:MAG: DNA polymerase Y family protein, partial [Pseudomonadota bacterium]
VLDISGAAHLQGGEAALADNLRLRLGRVGLTAKVGIAETRGAAWALAHFGEGIAAPGEVWPVLKDLPAAALRLEARALIGLERLGVRNVSELAALPRGTVTKRFGRGPILRLDQALGARAEDVSPLAPPPVFAATLGLPEPIGLTDDVMAALDRLLEQVCQRLAAAERGARVVQLTLQRVDRASRQIELRLARPMRDGRRMRALFEPHIAKVDAGYGIERLRLEAVETEALPAQQISHHAAASQDKLADLITRIGNRIGLDRVTRFLPADSHLPEKSVARVPAAYSEAVRWEVSRPRPIVLFPPELVTIRGGAGSGEPPRRFRWRAMQLSTARAVGPERIAPAWWQDDPGWETGLRDYWRVETCEGRRIWMFHTPQNPGWYVQGEFP